MFYDGQGIDHAAQHARRRSRPSTRRASIFARSTGSSWRGSTTALNALLERKGAAHGYSRREAFAMFRRSCGYNRPRCTTRSITSRNRSCRVSCASKSLAERLNSAR